MTKKLQENPIPFSAHQQAIPVSVREANPRTQKIIEKWMKTASVRRIPPSLKPIKFKQVLIEQRQGQAEFRQALMVAYNYKCAVTGCEVRDTLQAAHIVPVSNSGQHRLQNGLLLRADIHNLFDRGLLTIDNQFKVHLHSSIRSSLTYKALHGKKLAIVPSAKEFKPSLKFLAQHRKSHGIS
jgi:predicted restriction endonuclease